MKTILQTFALLLCLSNLFYAQTTAIPDPNFEQKLISLGIDSDNTVNGQILNSDAAGVTYLNVNYSTISDLTGIAAFVNLDTLNCGNNQLTSIDLSSNTALTELDCSNNQLPSLNLNSNLALTRLLCSSNLLPSLDLSSNIALDFLDCNSNQLTSLDLSSNTALSLIGCSYNQLTTLNLTTCTSLAALYCEYNQLASLDLNSCPLLTALYCSHNQLAFLDISSNSILTELGCSYNQLASLDLSSCFSLTALYCSLNQLSSLDLSNTILTFLDCEYNQLAFLNISHLNLSTLWAENNLPFLQICVTDAQAANANPNWRKDPSASYSENCPPKAIEGYIVLDTNINCQVDSTEQPIVGTTIQFKKGGTIYQTGINTNGKYVGYLDTGNYTISVVHPIPYYTACPSSQQITVDTNYTIQQVDFVLQDTIQCPYLEVDISAPQLRRCFSNNYYINYCNSGTAASSNAYIEIELDNFLTYNSSSLPLQSQVGNKYRFNVGNLAVGQCGNFTINATVDCNTTVLGQIHCTEAHIYPDSLCLPSLPNMQIEDTCIVDTVLFTVFNEGDALPHAVQYWILEDTTIVDTGSIQLSAGQVLTILYPTSGNASVYQLLIDPSFSEYFQVSQQAICNPATINTTPPFLPSNSLPFIATDCKANRGSYDPNDKQATPVGLGTDHYLLPNTDIEYKIRFQNTGTDTAIFINILDTLSSNLDVSSLQMGVSSHPYTWELIPNTGNLNILRIIFNPIYLPDSNVNEAASHGFVQYSIKQQPNLANFTRIENSAAIYFDYNAPVITNTAFHTICDNCIPTNITGGGVIITSTKDLEQPTLAVKVYPNPFKEQTTLEVEGGEYQQLEVAIYDITGKEVMQYQSKQNSIIIQRKNLPQGIYIYQLKGDEQLIHTGKFIIQ